MPCTKPVIEPWADNVIPVILTDEIIHTDAHPECDDPDCPCHNPQEGSQA